MNDLVRRILNMVLSVGNFGTENASAIAVNAIAVQKFALVDSFIEQITDKGELRMSAVEMLISQSARRKMTRGELKKDVQDIAGTAGTAAKDNLAFNNVFHIPRDNMNDTVLLEIARSFHTNAAVPAVKAVLIAYGLPDDFLEDLLADTDAFEQSISKQDTATRDRIDANASIDDMLTQVLQAISVLKRVVPNIFRNDRGKLADWASASHVEKPPTKKKSGKPPTV